MSDVIREDATAAPRLRSNDEAARFLGLKPRTLRTWRWANKGPPFIKVGALVFYEEGDLRRWLAARRVEPESV